MRRSTIYRLVPLALAVMSAGASASEDALLEEARRVAASVPPRLAAVLQEEISKGGFAGAVEVCRVKGPQLAQAASAESGWQIRRVSLKNRNPKAVPDVWEQAVLEDFDRRAAAGERAATLEKGEVVVDGGVRYYRYMLALPVQPLCLGCHGDDSTLDPAVRKKLDMYYPKDRATGYEPGQIRGAMTIKRALNAELVPELVPDLFF